MLVWLAWNAPALTHLRTGGMAIARLTRCTGQLAWRTGAAFGKTVRRFPRIDLI